MNCSSTEARPMPTPTRRRGRPSKTHDNATVCTWLRRYSGVRDFCNQNLRADDVLVGCALARERSDTGRGLHVRKLFTVLQELKTITSAGVAEVLGCADRTARAYAIAAQVASRAIRPLVPARTATDDAYFEVEEVLDSPLYDHDFDAFYSYQLDSITASTGKAF